MIKGGLLYLLKFCGVDKILRNKKRHSLTSLCFHRVSNERSYSWPPLGIDVFEDIIKYVVKHYEVISVFDINIKKLGKPKLLITFDDGYKDFIINALPILERYNLPVVLSVSTDIIEKNIMPWTQYINRVIDKCVEKGISFLCKDKRYMVNKSNASEIALFIYKSLLGETIESRDTIIKYMVDSVGGEIDNDQFLSWDDLRECVKRGVFIASHTVSHNNLVLMSEKDVEKELRLSKEIIKDRLGIETQIISYPNGMYNDFVVSKALEYGYKFHLTVEDKDYNYNDSIEYCYIIPRRLIYHNSYIENVFNIDGFYSILRKIKG